MAVVLGYLGAPGCGEDCPAGHERCACYDNRTCNDGLECRSDLCVEADAPSDATEGGAGPGSASDDAGAGGLFGGDSEPTVSVADPGAGAPAVTPLERCDVATATGEAPVIDDFEDGDLDIFAHDGREGSWYAYNSADDPSAHLFEVAQIEAAPDEGAAVLHMAGGGFEWAGFGMGFRWGTTDASGRWVECVYDASHYAGFSFWARGNDASVRVSVAVPGVIPVEDGGTCEASCFNGHGTALVFGEEWQQFFLAFADLEQESQGTEIELDTSELRTLDFAAVAASQDFDLWIDDLRFLTEEELSEQMGEAAAGAAGAAGAGGASAGHAGAAGAGGASG